jgi:hypothetical protein
MIASTIAGWIYVQVLPRYVTPDVFDYSRVEKPQLFYVAHGVEILGICIAGIMGLREVHRSVLRKYGTRLVLFLSAGLLMAVRGYSVSTATSTRIVDSTGPITVIISLLIFVGAQPAYWPFLDKLFLYTAMGDSVLVGAGMIALRSPTRWEAVLSLNSFLNVLYFPATWLLIAPASRQLVSRLLRLFPFSVYALGSIFTETRLNWVMIAGALIAYASIERRRGIPIAPKVFLAIVLGLWLFLFSAAYLGESNFIHSLEDSAGLFLSRLDEDTRGNQISQFFSNVPLSDLALGRGSLASWAWGPMEWTGGTDIGYLSLLFFGGLPLLLSYLLLHILPAFRAWNKPQTNYQLSCAVIALLWALRMFSSSYPGLGIDYYTVLLCIGGCLIPADMLSGTSASIHSI